MYLLYREDEREMVPFCAEFGVGLIPWSPLAQGILTDREQSANNRDKISKVLTMEWFLGNEASRDYWTNKNGTPGGCCEIIEYQIGS